MRFLLGTHKVGWLARTEVPLFISHRQARERKTPLVASADWALDSGGYTELSTYGRWKTSMAEYVEAIERYQQWGRLQWVAPQDWMTEPWVLEATGKTVQEHHERSVQSYLDLRFHGVPVVPVLQGPDLPDYLKHAEMYESAGVHLDQLPLVGVGSVCRREGTREAEQIFRELAGARYRLHGFGVKITGVRRYADALESADSMAWSQWARRDANRARRLGSNWACPWGAGHQSCANCQPYALRWRLRVVDSCT
jgi:hypothetical protein